MRQNLSTIAAVAVLALVVGAGVTAAVATNGQQSGTATQTHPDAQSQAHNDVASSGQQTSETTAQHSAQSSSDTTTESGQAAVEAPTQASSHAPGQQGTRTISVSASGGAQTSPDQVRVRVAVVATGQNAPDVRERLAENVSQMRSALEDIGLSDDQIRTSRYDLDRDRVRRPPREGEKPQLQYRGEHSFVITVSDTNKTGQIIDTAVTNGANSIEDIQFTLSEDKRRSLRKQALRDAMDNARGQADTLADASDLTITGVHSVETTEGFHRPRAEFAAASADGGGGGTSVDSGPVGVQVQVHVTYNASAS